MSRIDLRTRTPYEPSDDIGGDLAAISLVKVFDYNESKKLLI